MLTGNFRIAENSQIIGWAADRSNPDRVVQLRLLLDEVPVATLTADGFRPDLGTRSPRSHAGISHMLDGHLTGGQTVVISLQDSVTGEFLPPGRVSFAAPTRSIAAKLDSTGRGLIVEMTLHGPMILNRADLGVDREILGYGEYAVSEIAVIRSVASPTRSMIDIGANIGALALAMAAHAEPETLVHAFEPQPHIFHRLCGNLALNGVTNVLPVNAAISDRNGTVRLPHIDYRTPHASGGVQVKQSGPGRPITCHALDDLDFESTPVGFIKVDVEGHEPEVFRGGRALIERDRPALYFETRNRAFCSEAFPWLLDLGYRIFWHAAPLYRPDNFAKNPVDHYYGSGINSNVLAVCAPPTAADIQSFGLVPLAAPDEFWPVDRFPEMWASKITQWQRGEA
ncbi:FkbM family methyltransferase [Rhodobacteraceae bacterium W635]|uniref:FkbM family methyltransferase n=1 Tax=Nioella halotolerans TaxID=2303578 RepID=UPI000E3CFA2A|nr:FkbM family methyltransferase [Rhodobacteraceae bacterium W635]